MYVSSTSFQNNFGHYLKLCEKENVIVTKNGKKRAVLLVYPRDYDGYELGEPVPDYGTSPRKERRGQVTYREFLELTENSDQRYELIDGVVYVMAAPGYTHQRVLGRLHILFNAFFGNDEAPADCAPFLAPFDIDLFRQPIKEERELTKDDTNVVQPDLVVLCDYLKDIDEKDRYKGTPVLAVEIVSPSSRSKDKIKKLDLYMESGMGEFWIVDPEQQIVSVHRFEEYDIKQERLYRSGETAESVVFPGLSVEVSRVFEQR